VFSKPVMWNELSPASACFIANLVCEFFLFSQDASYPDVYWSMDNATDWLRPDIGDKDMYFAGLSELNVGESLDSFFV